jgi:hypothetical protein
MEIVSSPEIADEFGHESIITNCPNIGTHVLVLIRDLMRQSVPLTVLPISWK